MGQLLSVPLILIGVLLLALAWRTASSATVSRPS